MVRINKREAAGVAVCGAILIGGLLLTYQRVVFGDWASILGRYDVYRYFGPLAYYMDASIHDGAWPLWNPLTYCGWPFAANPQAMLWYPPNVVRSLLNVHATPITTQISLVVMMGLHLFFAGMGTRQLARAHGLSGGASLTSAVVFVFSALMIRRVCEYHFLTVLAWLPWLLLTVKHLLDGPDIRVRARFAVLGGLLFGMAILGGFFQIVNYMGVTTLVYACLYRVLNLRSRQPRELVCDGLGLCVVFVLGVLIAMVLLLPAAELAGFSARQRGDDVDLYASLLGQSPVSLVQRLIVYPGMKYEAETIRGAGAAALLLAMASLMHARRRDVAVFVGVLLVLIDCSFGPPFPIASLVTVFTPFSISAHVRACDVALLAFAILAGFGVDAVTEAWVSLRWKALRSVAIMVAGAAMLAGLIRWTHPHPYVAASAWVILLPGVATLLMVAGGWIPKREAVRWMLPILLFGETLAWNLRYVPLLVEAPPNRHPEHVMEASRFPQDNSRGTDPVANHRLYERACTINGYDPLNIAAVRRVISGPPRDARYHRLVTDSETTASNVRGNLLLKRSFWLARQYVEGTLPPKDTLYPVATTAFLPRGVDVPIPKVVNVPRSSISEGQAPVEVRWATVATHSAKEPGYRFHLAPGGVHSALFVEYTSQSSATMESRFVDSEQKRSVQGFQAHLLATRGQTRVVEVPLPDFRQMDAYVTLPRGVEVKRAYMMGDANDENGRIQIVQRSPSFAEVETNAADGNRLLVFVDANYPGWRAAIDGKVTDVLLADDAFKAVVVPPGTHRITFTFVPVRMYVGASVSALSLLAAIGVLYSVSRGKVSAA